MTQEPLKKRLSRAAGQLKKILEWIEDDHDNPLEIAQQLKAVANALVSAKNDYVQEQIEDRLHRGLGNQTDIPKAMTRDLAAYSRLL